MPLRELDGPRRLGGPHLQDVGLYERFNHHTNPIARLRVYKSSFAWRRYRQARSIPLPLM
jgi:hypothetical protein